MCQCYRPGTLLDVLTLLPTWPTTDPRFDLLMEAMQGAEPEYWWWAIVHNLVKSRKKENDALSQRKDSAYVWMRDDYEGEGLPAVNPLFHEYAKTGHDKQKLAYFFTEDGRLNSEGGALQLIVELLQKDGRVSMEERNLVDSGAANYRHLSSSDFKQFLEKILHASRMAAPAEWDWRLIR